MLRRTNELRTQPEFYNTLANNCSTSIQLQYNLVNDRPLPASLKVLFSGYSDELVSELGLMASQISFEELQQISEIAERSNRFAEATDFLRRIRRKRGASDARPSHPNAALLGCD